MINNLYKCLFLVLLILFFPKNVECQLAGGASSISMASADISLSKDVFSLFNNPSGLALNKNREIGIFYSPFPFGIKELANGSVAFLESTSFGNISFGISTYGFDLYKESQFRFGYANKVVDNLYLGFSAYYHTVSIKRYGTSNQINVSLGSIFLLSDELSLGFSLHNPLRFPNSKMKLPLTYNLGMAYKVLDNSSINFNITKEIKFPLSIHFGVEYPITDNLYLRMGTQTEPNLYSGGLGISYSLMTFNYAVNSHQELGLSHQFDLIMRIN